MKDSSSDNKQIANHIFAGSIAMMGVCITVIALFRVMKLSVQTYADELLAIDNFIFIAAALLSYSSMRRENNRVMELWADRLFFTGMIMMLIVSILIVVSAY